MKHLILFFTLTFIAANPATGQELSEEDRVLKTTESKQAYALGLDIGTSLKRMHPFLDIESLLLGLSHAYNNYPQLLSQPKAQRLKMQLAQKASRRKEQQRKALAEANLEKSMAFLEENKAVQNVSVTKSGLQYTITQEGDGERPTPMDTVQVHIRGSFPEGKVFDESQQNKPRTININESILGLKQGLPLMPVGSKFKFVVPSYLAYGAKGKGNQIEPNMALVYEIELLAITNKGTIAQQDAQLQKAPQGTVPPSQLPSFLQQQASGKKSIINLSGVSLSSLRGAAWSTLKLRNNIMPPYQDTHITAICKTLAHDSFMQECKDKMNSRLQEIREMRYMKANFDKPEFTNVDTENNSVEMKWIETGTIDPGKEITAAKTMKASFEKSGEEFRLTSFTID